MTLPSSPGPDGLPLQLPAEPTSVACAAEADGVPGTSGGHRPHRSPARPHALKVLYGDDEHDSIGRAAQIAGLRPSSYVAAAALAMAEQVVSAAPPRAAEPVAPLGADPGRR